MSSIVCISHGFMEEKKLKRTSVYHLSTVTDFQYVTSGMQSAKYKFSQPPGIFQHFVVVQSGTEVDLTVCHEFYTK